LSITSIPWLSPFRAVYQAGPTGYGLARHAAERGLAVEVCAPGHIFRRACERIKTDKRDAAKLARLLLAGELRPVRVPTVVRARISSTRRSSRAPSALEPPGCAASSTSRAPGNAWTLRHRGWQDRLRFEDRASEVVFSDYLDAKDLVRTLRDRLDRMACRLERRACLVWV
jgi:transposase